MLIDGFPYKLNTDFRAGIAYQVSAADGTLTVADIFYTFFGDPRYDTDSRWPSNVDAALEGIQRYLRREDEPRKEMTEKEKERAEAKPIPYDLLVDADIIQADFQREYGIDLSTAELHWWRFMALLEGLYTYKFSDRVGYRVADISKAPKSQKKELVKKRNLFKIYRGDGEQSYDDHIAYLQSIIDKHKTDNNDE